MTYGLEIKNSEDQTVIDTVYPVIVLTDEITVSGTLINNTNYYSYPGLTGGDFVFYECIETSAANGIILQGFRVISTQSTLKRRIAKNIKDISLSNTGYGMNCFNSSGDITYSAGQDLFTIKDHYNPQVDSSLPNGSWVCPITAQPIIIPQQFISVFLYPSCYIESGVLNISYTTTGTGPPGLPALIEAVFQVIIAG